MVVTKAVLGDKNRIRISIDGSFAFWIYNRDIRNYPILKKFQPEQEIKQEELQMVYQEILLPRAKETALRLLEHHDRSEVEIRKKLKEKEFPEEIFDKIIQYLYEYHYLNEERLVRSYLLENSANKSKRVLILKLREKGISEKTIQTIMEEEEYEGNTAAFCALKKKLKGKRAEELSWNEKQKTNAYLYRKGFSQDEIHFAWREYQENIVKT